MINSEKRKKLIKDMENDEELRKSVNNLTNNLKPFMDNAREAETLSSEEIVIPYTFSVSEFHRSNPGTPLRYDHLEDYLESNFNNLAKQCILNIYAINNLLLDNISAAFHLLEQDNYSPSLLLLFACLDGLVFSIYNDKGSVKSNANDLLYSSTYQKENLHFVVTTKNMIDKLYKYGIGKDVAESGGYPNRNKFSHGTNQRSATKRDCLCVFTVILNITHTHFLEHHIQQVRKNQPPKIL